MIISGSVIVKVKWLNEEKDVACLIHESCKGNDDLILGTSALASSKKWGEEMLRSLGQMQQHLEVPYVQKGC
ncbi:unnamed protein product [Gongylonema pulchrum]|uniref:Reverse transcriptase n=1 Tax=Gongylonema pulchrum TaxID=637853 RepID=A0A183EVB9_9BILA|nr:unnamed protein product [Gongylonema pulchrum]